MTENEADLDMYDDPVVYQVMYQVADDEDEDDDDRPLSIQNRRMVGCGSRRRRRRRRQLVAGRRKYMDSGMGIS